MEDTTWDVVATRSSSGDALWFGYHLAAHLRDRHQAVRLFTDDIPGLAAALGALDPALWMQRHESVEVLDLRLSQSCSPARQLIQVFDSRVPGVYADRFTTQRQSCNWFQLMPTAVLAPPGNPTALLASTTNFNRFSAQLGDLPHRVGYVKGGRDHSTMRAKWRVPRIRAATFALLELPQDLPPGVMVLAALDAGIEPAPWLRLLERSAVPVRLLLTPGPQQAMVRSALGLPGDQARHATRGSLTVVFLPALPWHLLDEFVWVSDMVVTGRADLAMVAAASGCPLLWASSATESRHFAGWYAARAPHGLRDTIEAVGDAWRRGTPEDLGRAWWAYQARSDEAHRWAAQVAERVGKSPEAADVLRAMVDRSSGEPVDHSFADTSPI